MTTFQKPIMRPKDILSEEIRTKKAADWLASPAAMIDNPEAVMHARRLQTEAATVRGPVVMPMPKPGLVQRLKAALFGI